MDNLNYTEIDQHVQLTPNSTVLEANTDNMNFENQNNDYILQNDEAQSFIISDTTYVNPNVIHDGTMFYCGLCIESNFNFTCIDSKDIIKHLWSIHCEKIFLCIICNEQFHYEFELSKHAKIHMSSDSIKKWECQACSKKFNSKNLLAEHEYVHTGERPYECECGKRFASKYILKTHEKTHEPRERIYTCKICSNSFLSKQNLKQHEEIHNSVKEFSCSLCEYKTFTTENNLKSHMITHKEDKKFICLFNLEGQECGKRFARKAELKDHERIHTGDRPYVCMQCGAMFTQRSNLLSHHKATHLNLKDKFCEYCGKGFKRKRLVTYHINSKHKNQRPYKCTQCDKGFVYPEHLKKHTLLHHNEKRYKCDICNKRFSSRDNCNNHLYSHVDKKQYECLTCGDGFARKPALKKHVNAEQHCVSTFVFNRVQTQKSSDANASWEVVTVPEIRGMNERANPKIQSIPIEVEPMHEDYTQQYYSNVENESNVIKEFVLTDNSEILQYNNFGNDNAQFTIEDYINECKNEILNPTNVYCDENSLLEEDDDQNSSLQQFAVVKDNGEIRYIIVEVIPGQVNQELFLESLTDVPQNNSTEVTSMANNFNNVSISHE